MFRHVTLGPSPGFPELPQLSPKTDADILVCHYSIMAVSFGLRGSLRDTTVLHAGKFNPAVTRRVAAGFRRKAGASKKEQTAHRPTLRACVFLALSNVAAY